MLGRTGFVRLKVLDLDVLRRHIENLHPILEKENRT